MGSSWVQTLQTCAQTMTTYPLANEILEKIKSSKNILITSHTNPDMDNAGSVLSFYQVLKQMDKNPNIVLADPFSQEISFLPFSQEAEEKDPSEIDFKKYDLLVFLDSATSQRVTRKLEPFSLPSGIDSINIDHHITNDKYAALNLVEDTSSTCELLYNLYKQWNIEITKDIATCLLAGITGDTAGFQYVNNGNTHRIAGELVDFGASPKEIAFNALKSSDIRKLKFWGICLSKMEEKKAGSIRYVWAAINFDEMDKAGGRELKNGAEGFFNSVSDTDFGVLITEQEKGILSGSFRARTEIDVSRLAQALGGGGHKGAAGFKFALEELSFEEGVEKVHNIIKDIHK